MDIDGVTPDDLERIPHEIWKELRSTGEVIRLPAVGGWVVVGRELASAVMRDAVTFTVDDPRYSTGQVIGPSMLSLDGLEHLRHRTPFAAAFRPAEVTRRYAGFVDAEARRLVAALAPHGRGDLRAGLAGPLAVAVVAQSLGIDDLDPARLLAWYGRIVAAVEAVSIGEPVPEHARDAYRRLGRALTEAGRRRDSVLHDVSATLSTDESIANSAVFLFGGIETSEGMTANLLGHLLEDPRRLARLGTDRSLLENAIEESLRLEPAATRVDRYATTDVELGGRPIRAGDLVIVSLSAANRDPRAVERPDEFDMERPNARAHLTFAVGPHACLGAQLARMEARAAVTAVLELLPGIRLVEPVVTRGVVFRKPESVLAEWAVDGSAPPTL